VQIDAIDAKIDFGQGVEHMNQVIAYERLLYFGYIFEQSGMLQQKERSTQDKPKIGFGSRAVKH
jgi:hypothetical protein